MVIYAERQAEVLLTDDAPICDTKPLGDAAAGDGEGVRGHEDGPVGPLPATCAHSTTWAISGHRSMRKCVCQRVYCAFVAADTLMDDCAWTRKRQVDTVRLSLS